MDGGDAVAGFDGRSLDVVCHGAESAGLLDEAQAVQTQRRRVGSRMLPLLLHLGRNIVGCFCGGCGELSKSLVESFYYALFRNATTGVEYVWYCTYRRIASRTTTMV